MVNLRAFLRLYYAVKSMGIGEGIPQTFEFEEVHTKNAKCFSFAEKKKKKSFHCWWKMLLMFRSPFVQKK